VTDIAQQYRCGAGISVREDHQPRVEHDRVEQVARDGEGQREDAGPVRDDAPLVRDEAKGEDNHRRDADEAKDDGDPEAFKDLGDLDEEVGALDFFLGCSPLDIVRDEMGEEGLGEMDGEATEEEEAEVMVSNGS
jgi:hypothetical protein